MQDPEGKTKFFNEIAKKLLQFTEKLERNNYIEAIARKYRIAYADLEKLVNHYGAQMVMVPDMEKRVQREQRNQKKEDGLREAQKIFLTWLIEEQELFYKLSEFLSEKDFMEEPYHTVAAALFEQFRAKEQVNPAKIINQFESKEEQSEVASMFNRDLSEELTKQEKERALNETVLRIKSHSLEYRKSHATDISELQNIIKEQAELQKLHISL